MPDPAIGKLVHFFYIYIFTNTYTSHTVIKAYYIYIHIRGICCLFHPRCKVKLKKTWLLLHFGFLSKWHCVGVACSLPPSYTHTQSENTGRYSLFTCIRITKQSCNKVDFLCYFCCCSCMFLFFLLLSIRDSDWERKGFQSTSWGILSPQLIVPSA